MINPEKIEKVFRNTRNEGCYKTLKQAVASTPDAYVCRCWKHDGIIIGESTVYAYGERVGTIRCADNTILDNLKREGKIL